MVKLALLDLGGTHVRFATADIDQGRIQRMSQPIVAQTAQFDSLPAAWAYMVETAKIDKPVDLAMAVACPVDDEILKLTNLSWVIRKDTIARELGVDRVHIINDFAAVCYAALQAPAQEFKHVCGATERFPDKGVVSVVGPGTGLGVAQIIKSAGVNRIVATEAGHIGFAPCDEFEDALLARLRRKYSRVSVERVVSGPGFVDIYNTCAAQRGVAEAKVSDQQLWAEAIGGSDALATEALGHYCRMLGRVAGDVALAHGAQSLVLAGGLGLRIADHLAQSAFRTGFTDKGRFRQRLETMPVHVFTAEQPGLSGAALSFLQAIDTHESR